MSVADSITSSNQFEGDTDLRVSLGPVRGVQGKTDDDDGDDDDNDDDDDDDDDDNDDDDNDNDDNDDPCFLVQCQKDRIFTLCHASLSKSS